jgi:hypothetical protein
MKGLQDLLVDHYRVVGDSEADKISPESVEIMREEAQQWAHPEEADVPMEEAIGPALSRDLVKIGKTAHRDVTAYNQKLRDLILLLKPTEYYVVSNAGPGDLKDANGIYIKWSCPKSGAESSAGPPNPEDVPRGGGADEEPITPKCFVLVSY